MVPEPVSQLPQPYYLNRCTVGVAMAIPSAVEYAVAAAALAGLGTTYPYVATALGYRTSDNGLAYILTLMGLGIWNGMLALQVVDPRLMVDQFFRALAILGALLAGLGWYLFAGTASSTRDLPARGLLFAVTSVAVGIDIVVALTTPIHEFYWRIPATAPTDQVFAAFDPQLGYVIHTVFLALLFALGTTLFSDVWVEGRDDEYVRAYTVVGTLTVVAILGSNLLVAGGFTVASIVAVGLTTIAWVQARRGDVGFAWF